MKAYYFRKIDEIHSLILECIIFKIGILHIYIGMTEIQYFLKVFGVWVNHFLRMRKMRGRGPFCKRVLSLYHYLTSMMLSSHISGAA